LKFNPSHEAHCLFENPLLPHRRLKELHALMLRCQTLDRRKAGPAREALLAAAAIQLQPGDLLFGEGIDTTVEELAPPPKPNASSTGKSAGEPAADLRLPKASRLTLYAAAALGLRISGSDGVVIALATAGSSEAGWAAALEYAHHARLPLLLVCADATGGRAGSGTSTLGWQSVSKLAKKLRLPVLSVDGDDAVAVYRVAQESVLRARVGDGPAVIWGVLSPKGSKLSRSMQPIARMESYLAARGLFPAKAGSRSRS
jgi:pyruvate dehydrogenase E1 component alpha subunit